MKKIFLGLKSSCFSRKLRLNQRLLRFLAVAPPGWAIAWFRYAAMRLLNHWSFSRIHFRVPVSVNIIHNCHGDDDDVAGKAHPIRELAKEDQPEKG